MKEALAVNFSPNGYHLASGGGDNYGEVPLIDPCVFICLHFCICFYMLVFFMYVCMCLYMFVCVCVCMRVCSIC